MAHLVDALLAAFCDLQVLLRDVDAGKDLDQAVELRNNGKSCELPRRPMWLAL